jgi:ketopantoate hydroxymethyltransferase
VVADLPFGSYETSSEQAVATGFRFLKEGTAADVDPAVHAPLVGIGAAWNHRAGSGVAEHGRVPGMPDAGCWMPKFVKQFAGLRTTLSEAAKNLR